MSLSLLIKPVSGSCNLNCEYCFYKEFFLKRKSTSLINCDKLVAFICNTQNTFKGSLDIAFQGGEPLLTGIDFYKEFLSKINLENINLSLQTNATLIDKDWCELFNKYNVLVGVSIDGGKVDNVLRNYPNGSNSFDDVNKSLSLLKEYDVDHNLVCVVSKHNVNNLDRIVDYFVGQLGEKYLQFIPCLKTEYSDLSLSDDEYYKYLQVLFNKYFDGICNGEYFSIRYFDELINVINGRCSSQCGMNGKCEKQLVIESDGSVYPCDFYCDEKHLLGNIEGNTYDNLINNNLSNDFTKKEVMEKCKECKYYKLCQGGCKRQRLDHDYCASIYKFLDNNINKLLYISNYFKGK